MSFFRCDNCVQLLAQLRDLQDQQLKEREQAVLERQDLIERLMALTRPDAIRELRREPNSPRPVTVQRHKSNLPGYEPDLRPPVTPPPSDLLPQRVRPAEAAEQILSSRFDKVESSGELLKALEGSLKPSES